MSFHPTRRHLLGGAAGLGLSLALPRAPLLAQTQRPATDATFIFAADVHACLVTTDALSPNCQAEGKTDANLVRHVRAINGIAEKNWPSTIGGVATGLENAGRPIGQPLGVIMGGDLTDDGGGQLKVPGEGLQLQQFASRYRQGRGLDQVNFPVYNGLGNHDLDQNGVPPHVDFYRRELRDYVELNHRMSVFYKPPVPVTSYHVPSDNYSWDWGGLHLVQLQRFGGDQTKGAVSGLAWLKQDLATYAADGRPVVLFQHYGWDPFSLERWDPAQETFDDGGSGHAHWWTEADRQALLATIGGHNVIGIFHGHEHDTPMIYQHEGIDLFKPVAAYKGGFAIARVAGRSFEAVLATADGERGDVVFTHAFRKPLKG
jgi:cytolysin (calcineurin-like family phosphatase)